MTTPQLPCGWNHRRLFFALLPVAIGAVAWAVWMLLP